MINMIIILKCLMPNLSEIWSLITIDYRASYFTEIKNYLLNDHFYLINSLKDNTFLYKLVVVGKFQFIHLIYFIQNIFYLKNLFFKKNYYILILAKNISDLY